LQRGRGQAGFDAVGRKQTVDVERGEVAQVERLGSGERACVQADVGKRERRRRDGDVAGSEGGQGGGRGQQQGRAGGSEETAAVGRGRRGVHQRLRQRREGGGRRPHRN